MITNRLVFASLLTGASLLGCHNSTGMVDPAAEPALLVEQADPLVLVYAPGSSTPLFTLDPFPGYTGPLALAEADLTGAGYADIIVGTAAQSSHVKVFDGRTGALLQSVMAFPGYF